MARYATLLLGLIWVGCASAAPVEINGVRLSAAPDKTRVVLDLSGPVSHKIFSLSGPDRVVIDVEAARIDRDKVAIPAVKGSVSRIRTGTKNNGDLRVVLDLTAAVRAKSFVARPGASAGHRLVIDLIHSDSGSAGSPAAPVKQVRTLQQTGRDLVIAVDAGHGGKDPGASGRHGTREKNVTLAIARKLKQQIDAQPGMRAVLVRDGDYFVNLYDRMERARQMQADLFVSIHADAAENRRVRGSSVYVLSKSGASSEAAKRLAQRENAADLVGGVSLSDKDDVLASVLLDLSQNAAISASTSVGEKVLAELGKVGRVHQSKLQSANFVVLRSPDIPSILVETAFISNSQEEKRLRDKNEQTRLASSILLGIKAYFNDNAPPGTLLAQSSGAPGADSVKHVISRGDTLSGIADRYNVSMRQLRQTNGLRNDRIRVGQVLTIPAS
ncbi:MAG: N-acetylmuramoyl-L-alanine amidase [Chromatiales bacterium]|jgi:N-acetylmuramoyl-L-alanine amidase|nr:N-acetylmuramoyl-L-alanine amidase [Chromatiales bacterium]MDH3893068.1 N-acetylmuramoyl-L-alanine amidase [Chromatiales bacterium]MDH3930689.1 N-acetylmuramoyl-L-alanine amidase [Chromatiales bacterium]MDH4014733.1 N-acetylmuramoyl-L-alanine amidase [Chromatiales bacterium]PLX56153.1 MAG: N-acetylmuramoyl-L-alanine amidase [Chromatiales bacterium]